MRHGGILPERLAAEVPDDGTAAARHRARARPSGRRRIHQRGTLRSRLCPRQGALRPLGATENPAVADAQAPAARGLWEENLLDLLRQKRRSIKADTPFEERQKLLRFAAGRGYEPALIYQAVNRLCGEEGEEADEVFVEPDDEIVGPEEADNEF